MTTETPMLSGGNSVQFRWRPWLIGWGIVLVLLGILLAGDATLDTTLWRATRWCMGSQDAYQWPQYKLSAADHPDAPWYRTAEPPMHGRLYGRTEKFWRLMRDMGEPYMTVLLLFVVGIYDRRRWKASAILLSSTAIAGGAGVLIGYLCGRLRPDGTLLGPSGQRLTDAAGQFIRNEGSNHWYFLRGFMAFGNAADLSFPSGHATLSFATAAVLSYFSPRGRVLFLVLAGLCALTRVVMQAHFYSDVIFGGALGCTLGTVAVRGMDRVFERKEPEGEH